MFVRRQDLNKFKQNEITFWDNGKEAFFRAKQTMEYILETTNKQNENFNIQ